MIDYADVVVGLSYGDEGKGKVVHALCEKGEYTHCIRFAGGNNAGHTIYKNGKKIISHSIPTGVVHGIKSIIGPGCVVNIKHFFSELKEMQDAGVKTHGLVFISKNTHIITDAHVFEDQKDTVIGTTKRGIGPSYRDKYNRKGVRAADAPELRPFLIDLYEELHSKNTNCKVLFEGAQGFGLDVDWGDYPYVTSSTCTVGGAITNGVPANKIRKVWGVTKIYDTYVGTKQFEPKDDPTFAMIREAGKEYGATTGRPRQCNWLDAKLLTRATNINGVTDVVINKVDVLRGLNVWKAYGPSGILLTFDNETAIKKWLQELLPYANIHWSDSPERI